MKIEIEVDRYELMDLVASLQEISIFFDKKLNKYQDSKKRQKRCETAEFLLDTFKGAKYEN